jgi:hypothetical protein
MNFKRRNRRDVTPEIVREVLRKARQNEEAEGEDAAGARAVRTVQGLPLAPVPCDSASLEVIVCRQRLARPDQPPPTPSLAGFASANRPLDAVYLVVFFDALRVKIRDESVVKNKAIYLAPALDCEGQACSGPMDRAERGRQVVTTGHERDRRAAAWRHRGQVEQEGSSHRRGAPGAGSCRFRLQASVSQAEPRMVVI